MNKTITADGTVITELEGLPDEFINNLLMAERKIVTS